MTMPSRKLISPWALRDIPVCIATPDNVSMPKELVYMTLEELYEISIDNPAYQWLVISKLSPALRRKVKHRFETRWLPLITVSISRDTSTITNELEIFHSPTLDYQFSEVESTTGTVTFKVIRNRFLPRLEDNRSGIRDWCRKALTTGEDTDRNKPKVKFSDAIARDVGLGSVTSYPSFRISWIKLAELEVSEDGKTITFNWPRLATQLFPPHIRRGAMSFLRF